MRSYLHLQALSYIGYRVKITRLVLTCGAAFLPLLYAFRLFTVCDSYSLAHEPEVSLRMA